MTRKLSDHQVIVFEGVVVIPVEVDVVDQGPRDSVLSDNDSENEAIMTRRPQ